MRITIASRKSDLARIQAHSVGDALIKKHSHLEIKYQFRESLGDQNLNDPLWQMPEKGVFTQDFFEDLVSDKVDLVVHSWKDLPIEERAETQIAGTLPREDQRDMLLFRKDRWSEIQKSRIIRIFSSSPRRAYILESFFKEAVPTKIEKVIFENVRGNVPTRVQKLLLTDAKADGLIVAKAAIDRLLLAKGEEFQAMQLELGHALGQCVVMILPLEQNPTAAAQGALAIEIKSGRKDILKLVEAINCKKTFDAVVEERKRLKEYGGGCHQKVGVSVRTREYGDIIYTRALTDRGEKIDKTEFFSSKKMGQRVSEDKIFPQEPGQSKWFERKFFNINLPDGPLWIAKEEALPEGTSLGMGRLIWASGFETWKKLAQRGIWVSGCNESLGESEGNQLTALYGEMQWTKLSHTGAGANAFKHFSTYELIPLETTPDIRGKTHFYWMSGSSFLRALEVYPWLKDMNHSCGPGNTFEIVSKEVKATIFPSYNHWKKEIVL